MLPHPLPRSLLLGLCLATNLVLATPSSAASLAITAKWPAGDGACVDTPLRLTFSGPVHLGTTGKIVITRASDHTVADTFDLAAGNFTDTYGRKSLRIDPILIDGNTAIIHPHRHVLHYGEHYLVTIDPPVFLDGQAQPCAGVSEKDGWAFSVRPAPAKPLEKRVVAADGTGDFCTLQGAVDDIPLPNAKEAVIFIKAGEYDGLIRVDKNVSHVSFIGEDRKKTILTGLNNESRNIGVASRSLLGVEGSDFVLRNLTVRNRTPWKGMQAEAVWVKADRCVLRDDDFYSFQDTLCLNGRVYVTDCYIEGDVDFIWGSGSVFLDQCDIHTLHNGYFVQARNPATKPGYIFSKCKLTGADDVTQCPLARIAPATFPASQVAYLHCLIGPCVPPVGWQLDAAKNQAPATVVASPQLQFEEYQSVDLDGKPLDVSHRLAGSKQLSDAEAMPLSDPAKVLAGTDHWNPTTIAIAPSGN